MDIRRLRRIEKALIPVSKCGVAIINEFDNNVTYNGLKMSMEEYEKVKNGNDIKIHMNIPRAKEG